MKSERLALVVAVSALALATVGVVACATADLIEAPAYDAGPGAVVSESGSDAAASSDAGADAGDAGDASADTGATNDAGDARADAGDASADAPSQG